MLGGQISNQDEDEVEDELDALEAEITGVPLPNVPTTNLPVKEGETLPDVPTSELLAKERAKERAKARQKEREETEEGRVAMLA